MNAINRATYDLICLSHLRWNFVFQRPQHLMTRCARERRCFYVEEPLFSSEHQKPHLALQQYGQLTVCVPHLPLVASDSDATAMQRELLDDLIERQRIERYVVWYYTPMALAFSGHLDPVGIVFDCMDELSAFANAPAALRTFEAELFRRATVVFTGGRSLYQAKRDRHPFVYAFPSSVDVAHFSKGRKGVTPPADQSSLARPRIGYCGVIDERMDLSLIDDVAARRPAWQLVMVGPVVKIDPSTLPQRPNLHYLGAKSYDELPAYIGGWDVAMLPFARNDATRFISPTKTPEYLAAGRPVVSTSIRDVVDPYGQKGLAWIADSPEGFIEACELALADNATTRIAAADAFLRQTSWDGTWAQMRQALHARLEHAAAGPDVNRAAL